jgi:hypothetical protein
MIGIAARAGIALGLHLRSEDDQSDMESSETRKRLWWSIFYLEHRVSVMTGRVSCIGSGSCTTRPPLPFGNMRNNMSDIGQSTHHGAAQACELQWTISQHDEQQAIAQRMWLKSITPSPSLHFFYLVDLALITHDILNRVYTPNAIQVGWAQIKSRIELYSKKMDQWVASLHASLDFEDNHGDLLSGSWSRHQVSLALNYYSARIVLNRPCLSRPGIDKKSGIRLPESQFDNDTASTCLRASLALIAVLPDQPDATWAYNVSPWWNLLSFLMQATIVVLIHLSIGPSPVRKGKGIDVETGNLVTGIAESTKVVLATAEKALRWLQSLGRTDEAAVRAFKLCNSCFCRIASSKGLDLSDRPFSSIQSSHVPTMPDYLHPRGVSSRTISLTTQPQDHRGEGPLLSEFAGSQAHGYDQESDDMLFQNMHTSLNSGQNSSFEPGSDIEMSGHPSDATLEEILLSTMGYNV